MKAPSPPRVVAIGGGHGLAATLRASRTYAGSLAALVSVADDGGSSGRLRELLGIVPPGDLRKCLVALAADDSLIARVFEHRFANGSGELAGHAVGNLVIAGLVDVTGSLQEALDQAGRLLGCVGRVHACSTGPVVLQAVTSSGLVQGQTRIMRTSGIARVRLSPEEAEVPEEAIEALASADQIVIGPGSLYTSVLPAALPPAVASVLATTRAQRVYVANLKAQAGETEGYDVSDHVSALQEHGIEVDVVLADTSGISLGDVRMPVAERDLARPHGLSHDPVKLASALLDLLR
jgi:uncharacterized cofD-like protein